MEMRPGMGSREVKGGSVSRGWWEWELPRGGQGANLPQQEDDQPQEQQPRTHGHQHQPQLDLGRQLLYQV